ncbi:ABC transporter ATP-binding protein, partial [bacterium]|nr:ABC transporter ATP-binding protein [bacterium]
MTDAPLIRLRGIEKTYTVGTQEVPAVRGVDLDVASGE